MLSFLEFLNCVLLSFFFFFFNDTATTEIYTLSLHDALPFRPSSPRRSAASTRRTEVCSSFSPCSGARSWVRSEEHTSELQSHVNLVCRLLLEKKKNRSYDNIVIKTNKTIKQITT